MIFVFLDLEEFLVLIERYDEGTAHKEAGFRYQVSGIRDQGSGIGFQLIPTCSKI